MIKILILMLTFVLGEAFAGTCATTSRTNYSSGQVLTSSALNADFNQLVSKSNAFDGGCVTDGTLEASALNSTDFESVTNGIHQGCAVVYSDANTVGVGDCILSVNGTFVKTTSQTNVTWGCVGCSAELSNTLYYLYAKTGSEGSTLNLLISTTAPGVDGYDASFNKVLGKFYNGVTGAAGDIYSGSIQNWGSNNFLTSGFDAAYSTPSSFGFYFGAAGGLNPCTVAGACGYLDTFNGRVVSFVRTASTGVYTLTTSQAYNYLICSGSLLTTGTTPGAYDPRNSVRVSSTVFTVYTVNSTGTATDTYGVINCQGY